MTAGARKKVETYSAEDAEVIKLDDAEEKARKEGKAWILVVVGVLSPSLFVSPSLLFSPSLFSCFFLCC